MQIFEQSVIDGTVRSRKLPEQLILCRAKDGHAVIRPDGCKNLRIPSAICPVVCGSLIDLDHALSDSDITG
jgi:hypothetical protein